MVMIWWKSQRREAEKVDIGQTERILTWLIKTHTEWEKQANPSPKAVEAIEASNCQKKLNDKQTGEQ